MIHKQNRSAGLYMQRALIKVFPAAQGIFHFPDASGGLSVETDESRLAVAASVIAEIYDVKRLLAVDHKFRRIAVRGKRQSEIGMKVVILEILQHTPRIDMKVFIPILDARIVRPYFDDARIIVHTVRPRHKGSIYRPFRRGMNFRIIRHPVIIALYAEYRRRRGSIRRIDREITMRLHGR